MAAAKYMSGPRSFESPVTQTVDRLFSNEQLPQLTLGAEELINAGFEVGETVYVYVLNRTIIITSLDLAAESASGFEEATAA